MVLPSHTFEIIDHTADLGIAVAGTSLKELFQNASHAMMRIMVEQVPVETGEATQISVQGSDLPDLMVRWLGEILYIFQGENRLVTQAEINRITPKHLDARIRTIPLSPENHEILTEIKAVTYHQIEVIRNGRLWKARIIFDL